MNRRTRIALFLSAALAAAPALAQQSFGQAPTYPGTQQNQAAAGQYQQAPQSGAHPTGSMPQNGYPQMQQGGYPPAQQSGYPSQPGSGQSQMPGGYPPASGGMGGMNPMQALLQAEMQDFGVAPSSRLQTNLHGPTPTTIPGGKVITTDRLLALYQQGQQNGLLVFHVLGPGPTLPIAQNAAPASQPGSFDDQTQREFGQYLHR